MISYVFPLSGFIGENGQWDFWNVAFTLVTYVRKRENPYSGRQITYRCAIRLRRLSPHPTEIRFWDYFTSGHLNLHIHHRDCFDKKAGQGVEKQKMEERSKGRELWRSNYKCPQIFANVPRFWNIQMDLTSSLRCDGNTYDEENKYFFYHVLSLWLQQVVAYLYSSFSRSTPHTICLCI